MFSPRRLLVPALVLLATTITPGCMLLCAVEQWKCDTFGCCGWGTRPRCGSPCAPGPVYPAPGTYGAPLTTPPPGNGAVAPPGGTYPAPSNGPVVPSF